MQPVSHLDPETAQHSLAARLFLSIVLRCRIEFYILRVRRRTNRANQENTLLMGILSQPSVSWHIKGGPFNFVFFCFHFVFFVFRGFWLLWLLAFVAFGFRGFRGFCGFWLLWLLLLLWLLAFWPIHLSVYIYICLYLSIFLSFILSFWQLFSFLFLHLLFLLFSLQRRNQTRKQASKEASKQASKHELLTFGSGVLLGGALRPPEPPPRHEICTSSPTPAPATKSIF